MNSALLSALLCGSNATACQQICAGDVIYMIPSSSMVVGIQHRRGHRRCPRYPTADPVHRRAFLKTLGPSSAIAPISVASLDLACHALIDPAQIYTVPATTPLSCTSTSVLHDHLPYSAAHHRISYPGVSRTGTFFLTMA